MGDPFNDPDRDDFGDDPGIISNQVGRLGVNKYGDGDLDDEDADYTNVHCRRNVTPLVNNTPDPYKHRH